MNIVAASRQRARISSGRRVGHVATRLRDGFPDTLSDADRSQTRGLRGAAPH